MIIVLAVILAATGAYIIGMQRERDRHRHCRPRPAPANPLEQLGSPGVSLTDREWEQFVTAIYALADGSER